MYANIKLVDYWVA